MSAGIALNDDVAIAITTVTACISLIADGISTLPLQALKDTTDKSKNIISPTPQLIKNPWPEGTRIDFYTQVMWSLLLRGNFFGQIVDRDAAGYATTIMPVHPDRVLAQRDRNTGKRVYRFGNAVVPTENVWHVPGGILPPGAWLGYSPIEYQRKAWALTAALETYGSQFFNNSAMPSSIISVEGSLSPDETLEMGRQWKQLHGGLGGAQYPAILTEGAKFQQVSLTAEDAQFLGTRQFQQQQIISWFRVPPHKVGVTDRTPGPTTSEELEIQYVTEALLPPARRIEDALSAIMRPSQIAKFDFSARLRGNTVSRAQAAQIRANIGMNTLDELRAIEDEEPLPFDLGAQVARPANMAYWSTVTGEMTASPSADVGAVNPGGLGDGGGDPNNAPGITKPDQEPA